MEMILGMDAGTHGIRVLAYDPRKKETAAVFERSYPRRSAAGIQEMEPAVLLDTFRQALSDALARLAEDVTVKALGITHQRGTVIPVDAAGAPLSAALCDSDSRAATVEELRGLGVDPAEYYRRTGCPFVSFNGMAKILWARVHAPELYRRAAAWLSPQDFLVSALVGRVTVTEGSASRNGSLAVEAHRLAAELFPGEAFLQHDCVSVGASCGRVGETWCRDFPALKGAEVIAVPGDQPAAVIGCGAVNGGLAMNLGTTFVASLCHPAPVLDPAGMVTVEVLPEQGFAMEFGTGAGGQFTDWLARLLLDGKEADAAFWAALDAKAALAPPGSDGLRIVPLLWQVTSPGVEGGIRRLGMHHTRAHLVRAAYEGLACEARLSVEKVQSCVGRAPAELRVFGGMSADPVFLQILASVTKKTVAAPRQRQASALGAALTAALACGDFSSLAQASAAADAGCRKYDPDKEGAYDDGFFRAYCAQR